MKKVLSFILAIVIALTLVGPSELSAFAAVRVTGISLTPTTLKLAISKSGTITPTVKPSNATNKAVTWKSSNTKIATVDSAGKVKAVSIGTTAITCTAKDGSGKKASCQVTVGKLVTSIKLNLTSIKWAVGKTGTLIPTVSPSDAIIKTVSWKSSNTKVVTVDSAGKITAKGVGTAAVTCTAKDGSGKSATCSVTVGTPVSTITLPLSKMNLEIGKAIRLRPVIAPINATVQTVKWTSSNLNIATVDSTGKIRAVAAGTATITCSANDYSGKKATCIVTVIPVIPLVMPATLNEIILFYNRAANYTKSYTGPVIVAMQEHNQATLTKLSVETVRSIAQNMINNNLGDTDYGPKTFINGDSGGDTLQKILPPEGNFSMSTLTAAGVESASCTRNGTGWNIEIKVKEETSGLQPPPYHSSCMDCISFSPEDLAPFAFDPNKVSFRYEVATITATINSNGLLESYNIVEPVYITGTLSYKPPIFKEILVEAEIDALWTQNITFRYS